jgi:hypothetical protein
MCIDYTSLNKACPKDEYPLPRIYQIVDSTMTCELLLFLDAYLAYHQICLVIDNIIHYVVQDFLLHQDGLQAEERGSYILEVHAHHLGKSDWEKHRSLH